MIVINKNELNELDIYKSLFKYDSNLYYQVNLINDLSKQVYATDLYSIIDNDNYTTIIINDINDPLAPPPDPSSGELILPLNGLYHMNIILDDETVYNERVYVKSPNNFIQGNDYIIYTPDSSFTIINR